MTRRAATPQADPDAPMRERCAAAVLYRDVPRYTGRTKSGFEREWTWRQCKCGAVKRGFCATHYRQLERFEAETGQK